jgi:UDP-glucose 4-epimerase
MKCLVTGGCGFIGSHLVDRLIDEGHEVIVIDNKSAISNEKFYYNSSARYYEYDICDYDAIFPLFQNVDWVFHLAAESRIQPVIDKPQLATEVNVLGTCNVLEASRRNGVKRFMYSSTSAVYGLNNIIPLNERMKTDCLNPYSYTKVCGEQLCEMYYKMWDLETVIFRYFNVYGERQPIKGQYAPVVGLFIEQVKRGEAMTIVGDGEQRRDFTYVLDIVDANVRAAKTENDIFGTVMNIGTGHNVSVNELSKMISKNMTQKGYTVLDPVHIPERVGEARETKADNNKIRTTLGWEPTTTIEEWLSKYHYTFSYN